LIVFQVLVLHRVQVAQAQPAHFRRVHRQAQLVHRQAQRVHRQAQHHLRAVQVHSHSVQQLLS
jgi:hypothetical protein